MKRKLEQLNVQMNGMFLHEDTFDRTNIQLGGGRNEDMTVIVVKLGFTSETLNKEFSIEIEMKHQYIIDAPARVDKSIVEKCIFQSHLHLKNLLTTIFERNDNIPQPNLDEDDVQTGISELLEDLL